MNAIDKVVQPELMNIEQMVKQVCARIMPGRPLDQWIAVNPFFNWSDRTFDQVSEDLSLREGGTLWAPASYLVEQLKSGRIQIEHIEAAARELGFDVVSASELSTNLMQQNGPLDRLPLLSDVLTETWNLRAPFDFNTQITQQVSQLCGSVFDQAFSLWKPEQTISLFEHWKRSLQENRVLRQSVHLNSQIWRTVQGSAGALDCIARLLPDLMGEDQSAVLYLHVVLARLRGWASWCAYRDQMQPEGRLLEQLLAIRLAWEALLDDGQRDEGSVWLNWQQSWKQIEAIDREAAMKWRRLAQHALEHACRADIFSALNGRIEVDSGEKTARLVFCIDTRSEVYRRAIERLDPSIETAGFAGFFGMPFGVDQSWGGEVTPHVPGLLTPQALVKSQLSESLDSVERFRRLPDLPGSTFTFVEALGGTYLGKMIQRRLKRAFHAESMVQVSPDIAELGDLATRVQWADSILSGLGYQSDWPKLIVLVGHGSQSENNPLLAGLNCGACGGQTGQLSSSLAADLLNDPEVRQALRTRAERAVDIGSDTVFVAALHNTVTDEIRMLPARLTPPAFIAQRLVTLKSVLDVAKKDVLFERAQLLGGGNGTDLPDRAQDWSEVRPEWALCNNAAIVVAPRTMTRGADLKGRAFLLDYSAGDDVSGDTLLACLNAPVVVAHWINLQYLASSVMPKLYGAGNKTLHNVVGGNLGVFEGNGGDLRIGLAQQSVFDQGRLMHEPVRLNVIVAAKADFIAKTVLRSPKVAELVRNRWMAVFSWQDGVFERVIL